MQGRNLVAAALAAALVMPPVLTGQAQATVASLEALKDNTLYESATGSLSNGAGEFFFTGTSGPNPVTARIIRRGLIAFDIAGTIPAGATINSVQLTLNLSLVPSDIFFPPPEFVTVRLRKVAADWGEGTSNATTMGGGQGAPSTTGDATWIHRFFNSQLWSSPGGDFAGTDSASLLIPRVLGFKTWGSTAQMVADVQGWLDDSSSNFGWLLLADEGPDGTARRFDSKENSNPSLRPVLTVDFTEIPSPIKAMPWLKLLLLDD